MVIVVTSALFETAAVTQRSASLKHFRKIRSEHQTHKETSPPDVLTSQAGGRPDFSEPEASSIKKTPVFEVPRHLTPKIESSQAQTARYPVSCCMHCIVIISCQFAVVYIALALCRTYHEITGIAKGQLESALRAAGQTLTYGPMICVLFLACRLQTECFSKAAQEPQLWVQACMYVLTTSVLFSTLLVLLTRMVSDEPLRLNSNVFDVERPFAGSSVGEPYWGWDLPHRECSSAGKFAFYGLTSMRYMVLCALYGGLAGVICSVCASLPTASRGLSDDAFPAMAVMCTIILAIAFFSTQLVIAVCSSISEFTRLDFPQVVGMMHASATVVDFAPMLAVLFLTAHLRALQHNAELEDWVQNCMAASTGAMCLAALLATLVPLQLGATLKTSRLTNEVVFERPKAMLGLGYIFMVMRFICMLVFYGGALAIIKSIFVFESPGPMATMPVSSTEQCVVNLTCQFFLVYFLMTLVLTASEVTGGTSPVDTWNLYPAIEAARWTVTFAPMLSIVFLASKMQSLVADKTSAVHPGVEDAMCLATWCLQLCCLSGLAADPFMAKIETDEDGKVVNKFRNLHVGAIFVAARYISLFCMIRCVAVVMVGFFTLVPGSAKL